ncbi:MAG TPA: Rha family transcriptional regulator [Geminicoccus sp.]|uniref:Rha family transcriptional regulator n=1 Tax=Geminicoccus sp. TaxID=2024832 RepID=UPI002C939549|nr:Rha family transcriptional regulator [Geminicoccus sp.]HWL68145.1 Rha family transcriptional regulator [Geminicoccus sp.]
MRSHSDTPDLLVVAAQPAVAQATVTDLALTTHEGEARVLDTDLASRLRFDQPRDIRKLIARHGGALSQLGELATTEIVVGKGQRTTAYLLNKRQAIFLTTKSETPAATEITIEIIERFDAYERGLTRPPAFAPAVTERVNARLEANKLMRSDIALGRLIGLDRNQAVLASAQRVAKLTGIDPIAELGATHLIAASQELVLTPTEIGKEVGTSNRRVNALLLEHEFQVKTAAGYEPTEKGKAYARLFDTNKQHGGVPIMQLKWLSSVVPVVKGWIH